MGIGTSVPGIKNRFDSAAATLASRRCGVRRRKISNHWAPSVMHMKGQRLHRSEVAEVDGPVACVLFTLLVISRSGEKEVLIDQMPAADWGQRLTLRGGV